MCFTFIYLEAFIERFLRIYSKLERITDTGQKVLANGNQLRLLASRGHAHLHEDSSDEFETEIYDRRAEKRRRQSPRPFDQFTEQPRQVTTSRPKNLNNHFIDFDDVYGDSDQSSNDENLYEESGINDIAAEQENKFGRARYLACLASNVGDSSGSSDSLTNIGRQGEANTDRSQAQTNTERPQGAFNDGPQGLANADRPQAPANVDGSPRLARTEGPTFAVRPLKMNYIWERMADGLMIRRPAGIEEYQNEYVGEFAENNFIDFDYDG